MVEGSSGTASRVTGIAGKAVIGITSYSLVAIIKCCLVVVSMTINTAESAIIRRNRMTIRAENPFTLMFSGIDREIFSIVVKRSRCPCSGTMACLAVGAELG